jgi:rhodanese-related sulfurtransferase
MRLHISRRIAIALGTALLAVTACSSEEATGEAPIDDDQTTAASTATWDDGGIRLVSAPDGAALLDARPENLVVLDVRTPAEYQEGHLPDAALIDFYEADFAEQLAELDRDAPYLLYCRSGNRSGQARALMEQLGFTNVADVDGGILAWAADGYPVVR